MKTCSTCHAEFENKPIIKLLSFQPAELETNTEDNTVENIQYSSKLQVEVEDKFCSHKCARKRYEEKVWREYNGSHVLLYDLMVEMCSVCGNLTHPSEFCLGLQTDRDIINEFLDCSSNGHLPEYQGKIICLALPWNMRVDFEYVETKCDAMYTMREEDIEIEDDHHREIASRDILQKRAPLIYISRYPKEMRAYIENDILGRTINKDIELFQLRKEIITGVRLDINEEAEEGGHVAEEMVLHLIDEITDPGKLYLPFSIMQQTCTVPLEHFQYQVKHKSHFNTLESPLLGWDFFNQSGKDAKTFTDTAQRLTDDIEEYQKDIYTEPM